MATEPKFDFEFCRQSPLFIGLEDASINRLIDMAEIHEHTAGDLIVEEGTEGDAIFLLYRGEVSVSIDQGSKRVHLATLRNRGAFFGEIALVAPGPRLATVTAGTSAVLLSIELSELEEFLAGEPQTHVVILSNIARVLAQRLRDTNAQLALFASS